MQQKISTLLVKHIMKKTKRIKGSASTLEDGTFTFTPYNSLAPEERNFDLVRRTKVSSLWLGQKVISARLTFNRNNVPPLDVWIDETMKMYNELVEFVNSEAQ